MPRPDVEPTLQNRQASSDAVSERTTADVIAVSIAESPVPARISVTGPVPVSAETPKTAHDATIAPRRPNPMNAIGEEIPST